MRIGIDARFLTHPQKGGFKTYTKNLICELAKLDKENDYFLYIDRPAPPDLQLPSQKNFHFQIIESNLPVLGMVIREQFYLPRQAYRDKVDLLHSPCLTAPLKLACPSLVTIHDMIWAFPTKKTSLKHFKRWLMDLYFRYIPKYASLRAKAIVTVSQASKKSILEHLGLASEFVFVTPEAASDIFRVINYSSFESLLAKKYNLFSPYILAIGSADPRKNIIRLIEAYATLSDSLRREFRLVIVWTHPFLSGEISELINDYKLGDSITFAYNVSDSDLVQLYNGAKVFVFPSLFEGFGLPPLEAMACGTPVAAANNSSIPEIVGDAAVTFDADNTSDIANVITSLLVDEAFAAEIAKKGLQRSAEFSWSRCAAETLAIYKQILSF